MLISLYNYFFRWKILPKASEILRCHIRQRNYPSWTSYFVSQYDCLNDQFGQSHFEFDIDGRNYHILRTGNIRKRKTNNLCLIEKFSGCFPYIKYHCTQRMRTNNLTYENRLYTLFKIFNFGIPTLIYGLVAICLIRHYEIVKINEQNSIKIYFLLKENYNSSF